MKKWPADGRTQESEPQRPQRNAKIRQAKSTSLPQSTQGIGETILPCRPASIPTAVFPPVPHLAFLRGTRHAGSATCPSLILHPSPFILALLCVLMRSFPTHQASYLKDTRTRVRNATTLPPSTFMSIFTTSAMRRSRRLLAAVSPALVAASSQDL